MTKHILLLIALVLFSAVGAEAQAIRNPGTVIFTCPDHGLDNEHEMDIIRASDNVVIQTILLGDPPADATGNVTAQFKVQPVAFGQYVSRIRAVAGGVKSDSSEPSNVWERAPGQPTRPVVK